MPLEFQKSSLEYQEIIKKVQQKLVSLNYQVVEDKDLANYAVYFIYHNKFSRFSISQQYSNIFNSVSPAESNKLTATQNYDFSLFIFAIQKGKIEQQVFNAKVLHSSPKLESSNNSYNTMEDVVCSIDAIFNKPYTSNFEEYSYRCLRN